MRQNSLRTDGRTDGWTDVAILGEGLDILKIFIEYIDINYLWQATPHVVGVFLHTYSGSQLPQLPG